MALINPVAGGKLTDAFGMRGAIAGVVSAGDHTGRDIAAPAGTPIKAAQSGVVIRKWWDTFASTGAGAGGNMVAIRGDDGTETRYAHMLAESPLRVGERVTAGITDIGQVGSTGAATGPHLHFEVLVGGRYVNPDTYLATTSPNAPTSEGEEDMRGIIYRAEKYNAPNGIYAGPTGGFVVLANKDERENLTKIGTPEVWLTAKTLDELIKDARKK
ncbi:M23 family metallopeptidase [Leucobacter sp. NPDC058333]|uniref:M23 family metallopeptidase n=1 Tax=Leucobacter sp. NPDC058333 TaxID=3346450 RepID=UPI00365E923A